MSRVLLLLVFLTWMAWTPSSPAPEWFGTPMEVGIFLGVYAGLVGMMGVWARVLTRRLESGNLYETLVRFTRRMNWARMLIPGWYVVGVTVLNWKGIVLWMLGPLGRDRFETPDVLLGTLPAFCAWAGLWWAQFPVERALREQSLLDQIEQELPVRSPPGLGEYFAANLRLQLLFVIAPVLLIMAVKDVVSIGLRAAMSGAPAAWQSAAENVAMFVAAAGVYVVAPSMLRRILRTEPLPEPALRARLDGMCQRLGLKYRDILLWHTNGSMGNALVMGVVPRMRYVLLSDLLLETMTDEQIEAVFAHELGHIVHRHLLWYVLFVLILLFTLAGPGESVDNVLPAWAKGDVGQMVVLAGVVGIFLLCFGYISRRFERQADVFAARTIGTEKCVEERGAGVFASALHRVAVVNNIPVAEPSWCHGSIAQRMQHLQDMSQSPTRTADFDRMMWWLYVGMVVVLAGVGIWTAMVARGEM